jgi:hypothetical protein
MSGWVRGMGIREVRTARRSPWQSPCVERLIGSIRRECLDYVIVLNERHLRRLFASYADYYHRTRTHLALDKDAPVPRTVHPRGGRQSDRHLDGRRAAPPICALRQLNRPHPHWGCTSPAA